MKDKGIQYLRICSMVVIVFYHCLCYYGIWGNIFPTNVVYDNISRWRYLCNIALFAFVFISGFLYGGLYRSGKYSDMRRTLKGKIKRLSMPYLAWGLLLLLIFPSISHPMDLLIGIQHLWFLLMMTVLFAIVILLGDKVLNARILIGGGISVILVNMVAAKYMQDVPNVFAWKTSVKYFPFFIWGILCAICDLPAKIEKWNKTLIYSVLFTSSIILFILSSIEYLPFGGLYMDLPVYVWLLLIYCIFRYSSKERGSVLFESMDRYSMGIYIVHHILIWALILYLPYVPVFMENHSIAAPILMFICVMAVSWLIVFLSEKNRYTALIFNLKKKA